MLSDFALQGLVMTAWAFASMEVRHQPLLDSLSPEVPAHGGFTALSAVDEEGEVEAAHALIMTYWKSAEREALWRCVRRWMSDGFLPDPSGLALLWMDGEWSGDCAVHRLLDPVMEVQQQVALVGPALRAQHRLEAAAAAAGRVARCSLTPKIAGSTRWRYHKLTWLIDEVESMLADDGFSAFTVLRAIEDFGKLGTIQWLKVAGDTKAYIIESSFMQRRPGERQVHAEFGCYVGYTAVRLGQLQRRVGRRTPCVFSLECDAVHAAVARHMLDLARLRPVAEVHCGLVPLATPRLVEEAGAGGLGFLFMDHRGTRFHRELAHLERLRLLGQGACATVDNCLTPAAPEFCWVLSRAFAGSARLWSLNEFDRPQEDWMAVCGLDRTAGGGCPAASFAGSPALAGAGLPAPPPVWSRRTHSSGPYDRLGRAR
mmetsp:Transcript_123691/g.385145  ORF Transcript_123691/g.385145 Transcript_123691/m.385145 type:complete len:429 (-) Transcript_123691:8-1294(-)